jgi:cysteinyl-tRNA synthetase, unknown class
VSGGNARALRPQRQSAREALKRVVRWGCQYQNVDIGAIASSDLDLIVLDPSLDDKERRFVSPAECNALKTKPDGGRRFIIAYLCVGEVDTKRWYWPSAWRQTPPDWVGPENPNWPGSRSVKYWNEDWQSLVSNGAHSMLNQILDIGFDGVFLDRVDAYGDWQSSAAAMDAMADFVEDIGARARERNPGFILLMQNAEALLLHDNVVAAIDAHSKESLLTGLPQPNALNQEQDVEWSLGYLRRLQNSGIPTFATEYIPDQDLRPQIRARLVELGFVPFFAERMLDRLPGSLDVLGN